MKLTAMALASCVALTSAYPTLKTCVTQYGSNSRGVPQADGAFTAMGVTWAHGYDAPSSIFSVANGKLTVTPPSGSFGFFVISDTATITVASGTASNCDTACDRLACITGATGVELTILDSDSTTCAGTSLVVGYASAWTSGNTLQFAVINACDANAITVSAASSPDGARLPCQADDTVAAWTAGPFAGQSAFDFVPSPNGSVVFTSLLSSFDSARTIGVVNGVDGTLQAHSATLGDDCGVDNSCTTAGVLAVSPDGATVYATLEKSAGTTYVYALSAGTLELIWTASLSLLGFAKGSVVSFDGSVLYCYLDVYDPRNSREVWALNTQDGSLMWTLVLDDTAIGVDAGAYNPDYGTLLQCTKDNGVLLGVPKGFLLIDAAGAISTSYLDDDVLSSAWLVSPNGDTAYIIAPFDSTTDDNGDEAGTIVIAVDAQSGKARWTRLFELVSGKGGAVSRDGNSMYLFDVPDGDSGTGTCVAIDSSDGKQTWATELAGDLLSWSSHWSISVAADSQTVYAASGNTLSALRATDGGVEWIHVFDTSTAGDLVATETTLYTIWMSSVAAIRPPCPATGTTMIVATTTTIPSSGPCLTTPMAWYGGPFAGFTGFSFLPSPSGGVVYCGLLSTLGNLRSIGAIGGFDGMMHTSSGTLGDDCASDNSCEAAGPAAVSRDGQMLYASLRKFNGTRYLYAFSVVDGDPDVLELEWTTSHSMDTYSTGSIVSDDGTLLYTFFAGSRQELWAFRTVDGSVVWSTLVGMSARLLRATTTTEYSNVVVLGVDTGFVVFDASGSATSRYVFDDNDNDNAAAAAISTWLSSPNGDMVYLIATSSSSSVVVAVDTSSGLEVWRQKFDSLAFGAGGALSPDGTSIYLYTRDANSGSGRCVALASADGTQMWATALAGDVFSFSFDWSLTVAVDSTVVYVASGSIVSALRATDGSVAWSFDFPIGSSGTLTATATTLYCTFVNTLASLTLDLNVCAPVTSTTTLGTTTGAAAPSDSCDMCVGMTCDALAAKTGFSPEGMDKAFDCECATCKDNDPPKTCSWWNC